MNNENLPMGIYIGKGSCGIAAGAGKIESLLKKELPSIFIGTKGCIGSCYLEPVIEVFRHREFFTFVQVDKEKALEIIKWLKGERDLPQEYLILDEDEKNLKTQHRIALKNCGVIDPEDIDWYTSPPTDGYQGLKNALKMTPQEVIDEIKISGLKGRGGAGFPTYFKWQATRDSKGENKYIICNADEGDPGAFMDRAILEGDPHVVLEGMMIAGYAIGAAHGIFYVRAEYPLAIKRLEIAMRQAAEKGYLGKNILSSGFDFTLSLKEGAGAFVCGEETALIASLEGERGYPRLKPPFPAEKGVFNSPSNINNVETLANVPFILREGGSKFAELGTADSKGTKVFALTGKIKKGGLVEIPMGSTLRDVIFGVGGGMKGNAKFKAVQMGGPSGGCIPAELLDTIIDYASLAKTGAIMGSGGMVVMDENTCMVDMARFFLDFTCKESCGKCTHCRVGTKRMSEILTRISEGDGIEGDIEKLEELAEQIKEGALCGLGQTAPNPVLTTIKYFRNEYQDHIKHKKCTAKSCKPLIAYFIDKAKCKGCDPCRRVCPFNAIEGKIGSPYQTNPLKCTACGKCVAACRFGAFYISDKFEKSK